MKTKTRHKVLLPTLEHHGLSLSRRVCRYVIRECNRNFGLMLAVVSICTVFHIVRIHITGGLLLSNSQFRQDIHAIHKLGIRGISDEEDAGDSQYPCILLSPRQHRNASAQKRANQNIEPDFETEFPLGGAAVTAPPTGDPTKGIKSNSKSADKEIKPFLTIFTTFKNDPHKKNIYKNTIRNWALFDPIIKPVMYIVPGEFNLTEFAVPLGWDVHPVPRTINNVPVFKDMFLDIQKRYDSDFYGYANGDILFDNSLPDTLQVVLRNVSSARRTLIVGRRKTYYMRTKQQISTLTEVRQFGARAKLFRSEAEDYFITKKNGYPWRSIPDFLVGHVGYDNWLVVQALHYGMPVIDVTETLLALHQTDHEGKFAGSLDKPAGGDANFNLKLVPEGFDYYGLGRAACGQFLTVMEHGMIHLRERQENICQKKFKKNKLKSHIHLPT